MAGPGPFTALPDATATTPWPLLSLFLPHLPGDLAILKVWSPEQQWQPQPHLGTWKSGFLGS
jgi:hypothetical protein